MEEEKIFLIVEEKDTQELKVLSKITPSGVITTVKPSKQNNARFLDVSSAETLSSIMSDFLSDVSNKQKYKLYKVEVGTLDIEEATNALAVLISDKTRVQELNKQRIWYSDFRHQFREMDLDLSWLEKIGVSLERLKNLGEYENLMSGQKTNLVPIVVPYEGHKIYTEARLSVRRDYETGKYNFHLNTVKREPELNYPFMGYTFTSEDRKALKTSGNLGHVVELLNPTTKEKFAAYVSVDVQTNDLIFVPQNRVFIPEKIGTYQLSKEERIALEEGKPVGVTMKNDSGEYKVTLQVNAERMEVEFLYGDDLSLDQLYQIHKRRVMKTRGIPNRIGGVTLTESQRLSLSSGKTLYMKGLKNFKTNEIYNSYITFDPKEKKLRFSKFNPNRKMKESSIISEAKQVTNEQHVSPDNTPKKSKGQRL